VPGGTFYRTYSNAGDGGANEADPATISGFRLDRYLVTVARFRQFYLKVYPPSDDGGVAEGGYLPALGTGKHSYLNGGSGLGVPIDAGGGDGGSLAPYEPGWNPNDDTNVAPTAANLGASTFTVTPGRFESYPVTAVNWFEAYAFCIWDNGFLPSAAELEYAQVGGAQQLEFPWGATDPGSASQYAIYGGIYSGSYYPFDLAPVGVAGAGVGVWGQLDLVGELWEMVLDQTGPYVNPCIDCAYLPPVVNSANLRVILGGAYELSLSSITLPGSPLGGTETGARDGTVGFRCARAP
jgi:formylglycine-generating enzyme required for sulfatase activity